MGLFAGFVGVVVLIGPGLLRELGADVWAELACLAAACSYAFGAVLTAASQAFADHGGERAADDVDGAAVADRAAVQPAIVVADGVRSGARRVARAGAAVLGAGLSHLLPPDRGAGATNALLATFLIPVSAIVMGIVLLGEHLSLRQLLGMAAIFVGIAAIDGRAGRFIARRFRRTNS